MQDEELWKRKAIEILSRKCFRRLMYAHCCVLGSQVAMKRKEKREKNSFLFVPIKCKCMLFPCEHHHIGFVELSFSEFKMHQSVERNCSSGNHSLKKKIRMKSKYIRTKKSFSSQILKSKPFYFQLLARDVLPIYHLHFPNNLQLEPSSKYWFPIDGYHLCLNKLTDLQKSLQRDL